ncbi:hypothetical protein C5B91_10060 [Haloferax sp. Atlit-10N]|uniref:PH domain-containing protein n=1 Tax=unclassified Haloferax TaxID=2625095 RepID=UPI000E2436C3|nr:MULTISPECIES: PH domain-containing protein [unclassified Haloferax]RDZ44684.1 hypothetical protein C5B87_10910 [Haloferax sp. Atlit-16N]RDZ59536.1 hypothetical protein C5B91_10060 [Haloferax sp. Atlit-10N]
MSGNLSEYLVDGEEIIIEWTGGIKPDGELEGQDKIKAAKKSSGVSFAATNQRIIYLDREGGFKDIDYQHISSVESKPKTRNDPNKQQLLGMAGVGLASFSIGGFLFNPVFGISLLILGVCVTLYAMKLAGGFVETFNLDKKVVGQSITLITGDEAHPRVNITTDNEVGPELSKVVRETKAD